MKILNITLNNNIIQTRAFFCTNTTATQCMLPGLVGEAVYRVVHIPRSSRGRNTEYEIGDLYTRVHVRTHIHIYIAEGTSPPTRQQRPLTLGTVLCRMPAIFTITADKTRGNPKTIVARRPNIIITTHEYS